MSQRIFTMARAAFRDRFGTNCQLSDLELQTILESRPLDGPDYMQELTSSMLIYPYQRAADSIFQAVRLLHPQADAEMLTTTTAECLRVASAIDPRWLDQPDRLGPGWAYTCAHSAHVRFEQARG